MRKEMKPISILCYLWFIFFFPQIIHSQSLRGLVNNGVEKYKDGNYSDAEVDFKKGTEKAPDNFEAQFNLGDAYFKSNRYDDAIKSYQSSFPMARNEFEKAKVHYNVGNSLLKLKKYKESIEEYKKSLKLNPNDQEAKYNLSYALQMLKNQEKQKDQKQDKKDEDKKDQEKKDEQKDQKENKKEEQKQDQDKKQNEQKQDQQQNEEKQQQPQQHKISKEEAERILEALKDNEKDLQKELRKVKGKRVKTDKDW